MATSARGRNLNGAWWRLSTKDMGGSVQHAIAHHKTEQSGRRWRYQRNLEVYERRGLGGYSAHSYYGKDSDGGFEHDRLGLVRSAVETAGSNIYAPQKPKPQFQTTGATWAVRRKAYKLDRICEGIINQRQGRWINVWALMADAATEACVQGCANIKVVSDLANKRIDHKLIPSPDIWFDPTEGREPTNMWHREPIAEELALELWGSKHLTAIRGAQPYEWFGTAAADKPREAKTIELQYAYKLPLSDEQDGRWAAVINGEVMDSGDWTAPDFPFVRFGWSPHREGPWYSGIADEGYDQAVWVSELHQRLKYRAIIASGQKVYYPRDSCNPDDLALNDARVAIPYDGPVRPEETVTPPFHPAEFENFQYNVQLFWDMVGISQVSAAARREQGVDSGTAIRTLNDTKAGRQLMKAQRYEQAFVDLAHQYVWRLRELAEEHPDFMVKWSGKTLIQEYKWKDADVEDDSFSVNVQPSSALPHDPAGRQQMVSELYQQGLISQDTTKTLMGWPDLEGELSAENSEHEYIDFLIDKYLDADEDEWVASDYQAPEGFILNKPHALMRFAAAWFRGRIDQQSLPPEEQAKAEFNLNLLVRWIREMDALMNPPAATVPGGAPVGAPPPGMPLPPGALPPPQPGMLPPGMAPPPPVGMPNAA